MATVEAWITKKPIGVRCFVVREDESTEDRPIRSPVMRGAQRELTASLAGEGYAPLGRWRTEAADGKSTLECSRSFRRPG